MKYDCFSRYLAAKKSLDDRSLNRHVWDTLHVNLPSGPLRVLEIGAGIGTMVERVVEWGLFGDRPVDYVTTDSEPVNQIVLEKRLAKVKLGGVVVSAETIRLSDFLAHQRPPFDLIIAHAFLDLIDIQSTLPALLELLKPSGLLYATINFDGITSLQPTIDADLDAQIERQYHQLMDNRMIDDSPSGDSQAGRHLLQHLAERNVPVLAAGSSDWVVHPLTDRYIGDEAYFLHFIVDTITGALQESAARFRTLSSSVETDINPSSLRAWQQARHSQIDSAKLIYIAHQLDVLAVRPAAKMAA